MTSIIRFSFLTKTPLITVTTTIIIILAMAVITLSSKPPLDETTVLTSGVITTTTTTTIPYLHCVPKISPPADNQQQREILLLHGARFNKEDWNRHDTLRKICASSSSSFAISSVTAIDFNVQLLNGNDLYHTHRALANEGIITGRPLVLVTPSASGKAIVTMEPSKWRHVMVGWVPIACPAVLNPSYDNLWRRWRDSDDDRGGDIPILAMHGTKDKRGQMASERLKTLAGARVVEMEGGHPCYLDSPDVFVEQLVSFVRDVGRQTDEFAVQDHEL